LIKPIFSFNWDCQEPGSANHPIFSISRKYYSRAHRPNH